MTARLVFALGFVSAAGALIFAFILEYAFGLEPCPLCWLQRFAMLGVALVCLVGLLHAPAGVGRWIYAGLGMLVAAVGVGIAGRHVWLQSLPADQVPACGPGLNYLMDIMPLTQVLKVVLRGDASCANIEAAFLGISLPAWTLIGFVALILWLLFATAAAGRAKVRW